MPVFRPEIAIFHRKTAPNGPKTAFSAPFSPARSVAARFRSENRPTPRRQAAKKLLKGRTLLGVFAPLREKFFEKRPGNAVLKAFWPLERLSAALFRGGGPLRLVFRVRKPPFQPENRKIRPQIDANRRKWLLTVPGKRRPPRSIVDLPGASFSANILPPAEGLCAFDPRGSFQRAEIIDYRVPHFPF